MFDLLFLGIAIGANNLAASLALGSIGREDRWLRIIIIFGIFEFCVPLVGIWLGREFSGILAAVIWWLGPSILIVVGLWTMIAGILDRYDLEDLAKRATSWMGLILLAGGLSLDNLAVGFGMGLGGHSPLMLASVIALCSMLFARVGLRIGAAVRRSLETPAEVLAGILLLLVALYDILG